MSVTTHVVLFKMGPSFSPAVEEAAAEECAAFVGGIPGVLSSTFGRTFTVEHCHGFTHCLVVTFDHPQKLEGYGPHPVHQAWAGKFVTPHKSDILKVDIDAAVHAKI